MDRGGAGGARAGGGGSGQAQEQANKEHWGTAVQCTVDLGKYQNCHLVLKGSVWFFLVLFLVLFSSVFGPF